MAYTAPEVAFVLGQPVKAVKRVLDSGLIDLKMIARGGAKVRAVELDDILYLYAVDALRDELTVKARNDFYHALKAAPAGSADEVRFGHLSIGIDDFRLAVEERTRALARLGEKVEFRSDGEPVLKGTDIEVHRIAALLNGGVSTAEICEDYPSLTPELVELAKIYAEAYPKAGRPYPGTTAKRALKGAGLEALDELLARKA